jgi:hypothetical protein
MGQPPFDPRMMVALLLHGYASGLYSSRRIARACCERNDFVMIVALDPPDFRTISDLHKRHLKALGDLFLQVLKLCETAGLVKLGRVALDGTKIKANASKHKAMRYEGMKKREAELKAEVACMLATAEAADAQEDETFGKDKRGDEMPDWASDKEKRLAKIQEAMAALEAEAKLAAEEERRIEAEKEQQRSAEGRKKPGKPAAPPSDEPDPKAQRNFTDPESRIMKSKEGFVQAYNAQAAVDADAQIIVAHEPTQCGSDHGQLVPLAEAIENNLSRKPEQASADSGYCSEANLEALAARGIDGYVAPGRAKHPAAVNGKARGPLTQLMRKKIENPLPIEKASGGTGVRTDQTRTRLPPVPVARRREGTCRAGHDLHHPQPSEAVRPRKGRLRRLPCNNCPAVRRDSSNILCGTNVGDWRRMAADLGDDVGGAVRPTNAGCRRWCCALKLCWC